MDAADWLFPLYPVHLMEGEVLESFLASTLPTIVLLVSFYPIIKPFTGDRDLLRLGP